MYYDFVDWAQRNGVKHSERAFPLRRLSVQSQNGQWPDFKGKAHNSAVVCKFLTWHIESRPGFTSEQDKVLTNCFVGWAGVQSVIHDAEHTL
eukprot:7559305-Pyramimonas_sp.AAC.1